MEGNPTDIIVYRDFNYKDTFYALTDNGLYIWGNNDSGEVGNGTSGNNVLTPYKVEGIDGNIKEVIANNNTVYVLTDMGLLILYMY